MSERFRSEGMWDRFGTTEEQETEALCDKHLAERINNVRNYGVMYYNRIENAEQLAAEYLIRLGKEQERRANGGNKSMG